MYGDDDYDSWLRSRDEDRYLVSLVRRANGRLLHVVQNGPGQADRHLVAYAPHFHDKAICTLAEYLHYSGHLVHPSRWRRIKRVLHDRAREQNRHWNHVFWHAVKAAVLTAIRDLCKDVSVEARADVDPKVVRAEKWRQGNRTLKNNLIPGTDGAELRARVSNALTEDVLGTEWRQKSDSLDAKMRLAVQTKIRRELNHRQDTETQLYTKKILSHEGLSKRERQICELRLLEDLYPDEIGKRLGISASTVRTYLARAREKLPPPTT